MVQMHGQGPVTEIAAREYLVAMTTRVPDGTSKAAVQDIRSREAARSVELAAQGHLVRLWRPPARPGEWRTLGLFAARDDTALESDLASMPLRVWRTDDVTPLEPHPRDPGSHARPESHARESARPEFLTWWTLAVPPGTPAETVRDATEREAQAAAQLAHQGHLVRLWGLPGQGRTLGLWRARDLTEMQAILATLPMNAWLRTQTTPLARHPSDPVSPGDMPPPAVL
jgi:muconolactone delta-isomerase